MFHRFAVSSSRKDLETRGRKASKCDIPTRSVGTRLVTPVTNLLNSRHALRTRNLAAQQRFARLAHAFDADLAHGVVRAAAALVRAAPLMEHLQRDVARAVRSAHGRQRGPIKAQRA